MQQKQLFDAETSDNRKIHGMEVAADNQKTDLDKAREIAIELCMAKGETNADEVGKILHDRHGIDSLGPAAGSIFKAGFEFTGRRVRSTRKKNHARELKVWRLATNSKKQGTG